MKPADPGITTINGLAAAPRRGPPPGYFLDISRKLLQIMDLLANYEISQ
jgi:hypothetical protein